MAGRGPRAGGAGDVAGAGERGGRAVLDRALVRICDPAGRLRGTGFAADEQGMVVTSHEAVDGLAGIVLHGPDQRTCVVSADAVAALPEADLALVRTEGLGLRPLPLTVRDSVSTGAYVRIAALGWREARVLGSSAVTYRATDRAHPMDTALELAIGTDGADALRPGGGAAGGPVLDASSGAVIAVLGTALLPQEPGPGPSAPYRPPGFAVPLWAAAAAADPGGPLAALVARNAATVPAYGRDLNLAGALHLTATSTGSDGPREPHIEPVERPEVTRESDSFTTGSAYVLGLVGDPGTGRTTELAALAARRAEGAEPAPSLWLRGADLRGTDASVADAVERALDRAARIVAASEGMGLGMGLGLGQGLGDVSAGRVARLVRDAGRPLLLLLDSPEEMPPALAHRLARWSGGTAEWLRDTGTRLVIACRAEYWGQAGAHFDAGSLHGAPGESAESRVTSGAAGFPACVRLDDLPEPRARRARARYGIPDGALAAADARHPLALRLLSEVRAARPDAPPPGTPEREEIFAAYLDLLCLRVAVRLAAANGLRGTAVRRLAAKVAGQVHEAARRCLGPGEGELDRASFETVFPWAALPAVPGCTGWASAVLAEGLLVPAGTGYRFAHEEVADWLQGTHLDVDGALTTLVHHHRPHASPLPTPRHRIGPVIQALLLLGRQQGVSELGARLGALAEALAEPGDGAAVADGGAASAEGDGPAPSEGDGAASAEGDGPAPSEGDGAASAEGDGPAPSEGDGAASAGGVGAASGIDGRAAFAGGAPLSAGSAPVKAGPQHVLTSASAAAAPQHPVTPAPPAPGSAVSTARAGVDAGEEDRRWWAVELLRGVLLRVPDAVPYLPVLEALAERVEFGVAFWLGLPLRDAERFTLLRRLVARDGPPGAPGRCLDAVAERLPDDRGPRRERTGAGPAPSDPRHPLRGDTDASRDPSAWQS